jgi:excisionase family DNA binding protein
MDDDPALGNGVLHRLLRLSPRSVAKLIDRGELRGFRVPGSKHRRVLRSDLVTFMRDCRLPDAWIEEAEAAE